MQKTLITLENDNNIEDKAIEYYKKVLIENKHLPVDARRKIAGGKLIDNFPWVAVLYEAINDDGHPQQKRAQSFMGRMGAASSKIRSRKTEEGKKGPSPVWAIKNWFENNDTLGATKKELAHFSGYTSISYDYAIAQLEKDGYEFATDRHGITRVTNRPNNKEEEIKKEMAELLARFESLKAELNNR